MGQKLSKDRAAAKEGNATSGRRLLRRAKSRPEIGATAGQYDNRVPAATQARQFSPQQQAGPVYRPLNRSQNELRLLRILPPVQRQAHHSPAKVLAQSTDMIECWIEYDSMDVICEQNKKMAAESAVRGLLAEMMMTPTDDNPLPQDIDPRLLEALKQALHHDLDANLDESINSSMDPIRKKILENLFKSSEATRAAMQPPNVLLTGRPGNAESWLKTWIWTSLSGHEVHPESPKGGYYALSYVWSDPKLPMLFRDEEISRLIKLSQAGGRNLDDVLEQFIDPLAYKHESALRALREIPEVQHGKRVWIDSLCINQSDISEKNHEVKRMGDIYTQAERVISWIGEDEDYAGQVLEMMNTIGGSIVTPEDGLDISKWFFSFIESNFGIYIAKVLVRPYWSRIWIVQEIAMGSEKSVTICGNRRFPTIHLLRFASRLLNDITPRSFNRHLLIQDRSKNDSDAMDVGLLTSGLRQLSDICALQKNLQMMTSELTPAATLWFRISSGHYATNPKDLVYGMLNLFPRQISTLIEPDYRPEYPFRNVMVDFATANIQANAGILWILFRPWCPFPGWEDWPSWVPNLGLPFSSAHFHFNLNFDSRNLEGEETNTNSYSVHYIMQNPALPCPGYFIDTINQSTKSRARARADINQELAAQPWLLDEIAHSSGIDERLLRKQTRSTAAACFPEPLPPDGLWLPSSSEHRYGDVRGLMSALSTCFQKLQLAPLNDNDSIFDMPIHMLETTNTEFQLQSLQSFTVDSDPLRQLHAVVEQFSTIDLWGLRLRDLFARTYSDRPIPEIQVLDRTAHLGRLFTTCSGYVGTTINNVCFGDRLYYLPGCPMLVALRPSMRIKGAFELVGCVHIPGLVEDKTVEGIMANHASREAITLV